jgi:hypothetical protein
MHVPVSGRIPALAQGALKAPPSPEPAPWAALRRAVATVVAAHAGTQEAAPAHPSPSTEPGGVGGSGAPVPPGLSVHIEPTAQGVAVWVGLFSDPDTPLPQCLDALLQALRQRLHQDGAALRSLTVNGRVVWSAPSNLQISNNANNALKEV